MRHVTLPPNGRPTTSDGGTLGAALVALYDELIVGPRGPDAHMLNRGDPGLLRSLDHLSSADASAAADGGGSVAAHVDHLRYYLSRMSGAASGESLEKADWSASWRLTHVTPAEWDALRAGLRAQVLRWRQALATREPAGEEGLKARAASIAHLAYHVGAIRQIARAARGPRSAH